MSAKDFEYIIGLERIVASRDLQIKELKKEKGKLLLLVDKLRNQIVQRDLIIQFPKHNDEIDESE